MSFAPEINDEDYKAAEPIHDFEKQLNDNLLLNSIVSDKMTPCSINTNDFASLLDLDDSEYTLTSEVTHLMNSIKSIAKDMPDDDLYLEDATCPSMSGKSTSNQ